MVDDSVVEKVDVMVSMMVDVKDVQLVVARVVLKDGMSAVQWVVVRAAKMVVSMVDYWVVVLVV